MTMREVFDRILKEYIPERTNSKFRGNGLGRWISNTAPKIMKQACSLPNKYLVSGSPGKGVWAEVPWIGVFDKEVTDSAQRGYYAVYLFCSDMSGFYLSLNQGWTQFQNQYGIKEGKKKIRKNSVRLRELLKSTLSDFSFEEINFKSNKTLAEGYRLGHICGKLYARDFNDDTGSLVDDLRNLLGVYRELKGVLGANKIVDGVDGFSIGKIEEVEYQTRVQRAEPKMLPAGPVPKPEPVSSISGSRYPRDPAVAKAVLVSRGFVCEVNSNHKTFTSRVYKQNFVEAHHLIPMEFQEEFDFNLDVSGNIVSLCPNCHRLLHHSTREEKKEILNDLYSKMKSVLDRQGLKISLDRLLSIYSMAEIEEL